MIKILFICHGNICRSVAAEMVLKQMVRERGLSGIRIDSAATTREEIGNDVYPPMKKTLAEAGYVCERHAARQTVRGDYDRYDLLIGMDQENLYDMHRIYGGDPQHRISLLRSWAGENREIDDPWYTRDFRTALEQIERGCEGLLDFILTGERKPGGHRDG